MEEFDEEYRKTTYIQLIRGFLEKHEKPTEDELYNFIIDNEWRFYDGYKHSCDKEDLLQELEDRGYKRPEDKVFNYMLETYEDRLGDSEEWHYILNGVVEDFEVDLEKEVSDDE